MTMNLTTPRHALIEKTAGEIAACFYEQGRSLVLKSKYKNARAYAKANIEKFVPKATEILIEMLGRNDISEVMKQEIYAAVMERAHDPDLVILDKPKDNVDSAMKVIRAASNLKFDISNKGLDHYGE